jgi:hypothetical protein
MISLKRFAVFVSIAAACGLVAVFPATGVSFPFTPQTVARGDQLVRGKGGEYSLRVPAGWRLMLFTNGVEAIGDGVWMKLMFSDLALSLRSVAGQVEDDTNKIWKEVTGEKGEAKIGGNSAEVRILRGINEKGVRTVRRVAFFNPMPPDPGGHTYAFMFDIAEKEYPKLLPLIQQIEQSFRVGVDNAAPPLRGADAVPAAKAVTQPAIPGGIRTGETVSNTQISTELVPHQADDGSLKISLPEDWRYAAAGGKIVASAPGGRAGFAFTSIEVIPPVYGRSDVARGVIASSYKPPAQFLPEVFAQLGNRNVRVVSHQPDSQTNQECLNHIARQCESEDTEVTWVSPEGSSCRGAFKMINATPNSKGLWFTILSGTWGPADDELARWLPLLERVGSSFEISDKFSKRYVKEGLERLKKMSQRWHAGRED